MEIQMIDSYIYLGHEIRISSHNQTSKLLRRTTLGWAAFGKLRDVFYSKVQINLKRKVFNQSALPVLIYGANTFARPSARWTNDIKRISSNWIATVQNREEWKTLEQVYVQQWMNAG